MELMDAISKRRSIRKYKPDPVPQEDIEYVLEAARLAPSWANTQCWHFIVVTDEKARKVLADQSMPWSWISALRWSTSSSRQPSAAWGRAG